MKRTPGLLLTFVLGLAGCQLAGAPPGQEAPEACFPVGTALSYAGRSATAALNVQEVVGDPLSFDPADIYITRDKFDQGDLHGRLVCAIYVDQGGFVEITVHPADGGRFSEEPVASATAPPHGISRQEATEIAREALPAEDSEELLAMACPVGTYNQWAGFAWAADLPADLWVWMVSVRRGDGRAQVVIDFVDGRVYGVAEFIS